MDDSQVDGSVARLLADLKQGDQAAATDLWNRYFERLAAAARRKMRGMPRRSVDEEDVVVSVFDSLCEGVAQGRFPTLNDPDDLWRVLTVITHQKVVDQMRKAQRQKRGGGNIRGDSLFGPLGDPASGPGFDGLAGDEPTSEFVAEMEEQTAHLFALLDDALLRKIAHDKLDGYTNQEIAGRVDISLASVERKLKLIRQRWERALEEPLE